MFQTCMACLMGDERRKPLVSAFQSVHGYVWVPGKFDFRLGRVQQFIRVSTVNDIHAVPLVSEGVRQSINVHRIPAETVWRVECRQVEKIERTAHCVTTCCMTLIIWRAAESQVSRPAAASPAPRICCRR